MFAHWPLLSAPHGWQRRKFRRELLRLPGKVNKLDGIRKRDQAYERLKFVPEVLPSLAERQGFRKSHIDF